MSRQEFKPGDRLHFEYHCFQSDASADARLWHHTRQWAKVMRVVQYPEINDIDLAPMYDLVFADGFTATVFKDEVTTRPRKNPEKRGIIVPPTAKRGVAIK